MTHFSVIVPLYNKQDTILKTVQSVLAQSYPHFELIIVNDGSTDESLEIVNSIDDNRIRIINKPNSGVSDTRNLGIKEANYDWIVLLDGDDLKDEKALQEIEQQIKIFSTHKIFSTGYSIILSDKKKRYVNKCLPAEGHVGIIDYIDCLSAGEPPINSSNSAIHKSLFSATSGFISGQKNYEDHELWLRMYSENGIVFINKDLLNIRRDLEGTARQNKIAVIDLKKYFITITNVKQKLNWKRKKKFNKFCNLYCLYVFKRFFKQYSGSEKKELLCAMNQVASKPIVYLMRILDALK